MGHSTVSFFSGGGPDSRQVHLRFFTDPLCIWSWILESTWPELEQDAGRQFSVEYIMGGLIPDWKSFRDNENSVTSAGQMAPYWLYASQLSGIKADVEVWSKDPPASSYPASIAVKAAGFQSLAASRLYLRLCRKAIMIDGLNIARETVLREIARDCKVVNLGFDPSRFDKDLRSPTAATAFKLDLDQTMIHRISRFPTIIAYADDHISGIAQGMLPTQELIKNLNLARDRKS